MANGLLDYIGNFDINKALGVQYSLPQNLLSPNIGTQLGVGGTITGVGNVIKGINEGAGTPESIYNFLAGQKAGRQNVIDTATKNYINQLNIAKTQQDLAKSPLEILKLRQETDMNPYKQAKLMFEVEAGPYNVQKAKDEAFKTSSFSRAIREEINDLIKSGNEDLIPALEGDPAGYFKDKRAGDARFRGLEKVSIEQENIAKTMGLNLANQDTWTPAQQKAFTYIITRPNQQSINELRKAEKMEKLKNPNYQISDEMSMQEALSAYMKDNLNVPNAFSITGKGGNVQAQNNQSPYRKNKLDNGNYVDYFGKEYTEQEWNDLGLEFQNANKTHLTQEQQYEKESKAEKEAQGSGQEQRYLFTTISEANRVIRELLNDPQAIKDMQSMGGKFLQNVAAGKYGITSNPQDAANLLTLIQNKQFIQEIQNMRTNNQTGGAVGNVSDREVRMFINAAAALQGTSSPEALYKQLVDLHKKGENILKSESTKYKREYGKKYYELYELQGWLDTVEGHEFLPYKDAIKLQKIENLNLSQEERNLMIKQNKTREEVLEIINSGKNID